MLEASPTAQLKLQEKISKLGLEDLAEELGIKIPNKTDLLLESFLTNDDKCNIIKEKVKKLSSLKVPVLILGESGTGKELIAKALHGSRKGEFIAVNCSGIPNDLLESEFFGAIAGAYTSCNKNRSGLISLAENGTLFLDEIGDMPWLLQSKLLRFLQDGKYRPVGGGVEMLSNTRVVAATNQKLRGLVNDRKFREDLYYRLNKITLAIPPLRERRSDIELICNKYLKVNMLREDIFNNKLLFPGNVRELLNIIEYINIFEELPIII